MIRTARALALIAAVASAAVALVARPSAAAGGDARSVVFFIGDGMGLGEITLGRLAAEKLGHAFALDRFTTLGLVATPPLGAVVTDSAASGTALACGVKTKNYAIGTDAEGRPRRTILEVARAAGFATGLVTTTRLTDATPAAFASHVRDRSQELEIARQLSQSGADVMLGGGRDRFDDVELAALRARGTTIVETRLALVRASGPRVLGLFASGHMSFELDRDQEREPSLAHMTERAIDLLAERGRFFLMVEGGRIDHAAHFHDAAAIARDEIAFADAVAVAQKNVERLRLCVVVTADHATGSLGITERTDLAAILAVASSAEKIYDDPKSKDDAALVALVRERAKVELDDADVASVRRWTRDVTPVVALGHAVSRRLGVTFFEVAEQEANPATHGHEGALVPLFAAGPGAERFAGTRDSTTIPLAIADALGLGPPGAIDGPPLPARPRFR